MFVKNIAVSVFGTDYLKKHSVKGKRCNKTKSVPRPAIDSTKALAIRGNVNAFLNMRLQTISNTIELFLNSMCLNISLWVNYYALRAESNAFDVFSSSKMYFFFYTFSAFLSKNPQTQWKILSVLDIYEYYLKTEKNMQGSELQDEVDNYEDYIRQKISDLIRPKRGSKTVGISKNNFFLMHILLIYLKVSIFFQ